MPEARNSRAPGRRHRGFEERTRVPKASSRSMASTDEGHSRDDLLIAALARGATQARAAQESGCSERTVRRRLEDENFRARVQAAREEPLQRATGALAAGAPSAVNTLLKLMTSAKNESVRLGAAKALFDQLPLRQMLAELAELPEAQIIEVVVGDWRREYQKRLDRGDVLSAKGPGAKKIDNGSKSKEKADDEMPRLTKSRLERKEQWP